MIWATVTSQCCFCWLYRVPPTLAAKNIISLILVLTIWWCPCVESSLVLLEEGVCYDQCVLLAKRDHSVIFEIASKYCICTLLKCSTWMKSQKWQDDSCSFPGKPFTLMVIQVYAPTSSAEKAEVEWFYKELQHLLEWTPKITNFAEITHWS